MHGVVSAGVVGAASGLMGLVAFDWSPVQAIGLWAASGPAGVIALIVATLPIPALIVGPRT